MADQRLQEAVATMVDRLDRRFLRALQRDGYLCAANAFEHTDWSSEQLTAAVERCQRPTQQLNHLMQQEMQHFQSRVQRCAHDCQDRAQDALPAGGAPSDAQLARAQQDMDACVRRCVDTHVGLLPTLSARIEQAASHMKDQAH